MISTLRLRNFKCFDDAIFRLGKITLLAGANGTGKSSVIQGLLVLRHWGRSPDSSWRWSLVDVDIGSFSDVLYDEADDVVELRTVYDDDTEFRGTFNRDGAVLGSEVTKHGSLLRDSMFYLSADRLGPRETRQFRLEDGRSGTPIGKRGEQVLWYLAQHEDDPVASLLRHPDEANTTLLAQTNAWLSTISPGVQLFSGSPFHAADVGVGASSAIPLIVALLAAQDDDLVIVENPEAHLHPRGQTCIAELAGRAAAEGRQVVLETHSDHVLDGIRLGVAKQVLSAEDVAIYFFRRADAGIDVAVPKIRADGTLDSWPEGFFDQQEKNLARLIEIRRSGERPLRSRRTRRQHRSG